MQDFPLISSIRFQFIPLASKKRTLERRRGIARYLVPVNETFEVYNTSDSSQDELEERLGEVHICDRLYLHPHFTL